MIFIPNYHWNHTKLNFGMIPVVIWYEYHTSAFALKVNNMGTLRTYLLSTTKKMHGSHTKSGEFFIKILHKMLCDTAHMTVLKTTAYSYNVYYCFMAKH